MAREHYPNLAVFKGLHHKRAANTISLKQAQKTIPRYMIKSKPNS